VTTFPWAFLSRVLPPQATDIVSSRRFRVRGPSMEPTLPDGVLVLVSRAAYLRMTPSRGDLVLLRLPGEGGEYVKRVVGLPGETVRVEQGHVFIAGFALVEPYRLYINRMPSNETGPGI